MDPEIHPLPTLKQRLAGWLVHAFTALGAYLGVLALFALHQHTVSTAFWLMFSAIVVDAMDGTLARYVHVKTVVPRIDGALLDNIVDFFNYTIVPAFFILVEPLVPPDWCFSCVIAITFASAYQFTQVDAKTNDHFFKGFPSYWNIAVFYLFFWQMAPWTNLLILFLLAVLSFVPIKYIYPSRLDYLTHSKLLRVAMLAATVVWALSTAGLLWIYPATNHVLVFLSMGYIVLYVVMSLYRTWVPLAASPIKKRYRRPRFKR